MSYIAVYGSLRKGQGNAAYRDVGYDYIGTSTIEGWDLYSLGPYPAIKKSENKKKPLVVDIFKCSNEQKKSIDRMELGAGYEIEKLNVSVDNKEYNCDIYKYLGRVEKDKLVINGDWVNPKYA